MVSKVVLKGEPKSTGHIYRHTCRGSYPTVYMTSDGKSLKESYQWQAKTQFKKQMILGEVEIYMKFFFGTKRKCDVDNFNKIVLDSLTGIVWEDDSQISLATMEKNYDKNDPRIEITIKEIT